MAGLGRTLFFLGLGVALVGLLLVLADAPAARALFARLGLTRFPLFRLPGDIFIRRGGFTFAFPIVTCLIVSVVLSLLFALFRR